MPGSGPCSCKLNTESVQKMIVKKLMIKGKLFTAGGRAHIIWYIFYPYLTLCIIMLLFFHFGFCRHGYEIFYELVENKKLFSHMKNVYILKNCVFTTMKCCL